MEQRLSPAWHDNKKYLWLLALLVPTLPFGGLWLWYATHSPLAWWLAPVVVFGVIPLVDVLFGDDRENPPEELAGQLQEVRYYRWITYLYLPVQYVALVVCCQVWTDGGLGVVGTVGLVFTLGIVNGIAINTAHELGHKRETVERWLSKIALAPTGYGHFYVEHNRGHHTRVATPEDPASSRLGESFWAFWPRTVVGSLRSAWRLETNRFRIRSRSPWTVRNDVLNAWVMTVVLFVAAVAVFGVGVVPFLLLQAVVGFSLLEVVNYLEHYGLRRQRNAAGRYEKVDPRHSWNSDRIVTNVFLFQLQRHSDHHANPLRRYQALRSFDVSPQLPGGYATMIVAAVITPLWRRIMDPRVIAHYDGDLSLANVHRPALERLRARYPEQPAAQPGTAPSLGSA
ncbi:alkane 1-monooxygenase [Planosporangium mesophilum]|uniref:Alkane 1-monooxygenase n=1 Tax=Planosporangium mesophilum TaxID=689768 RepID=A0A8J3X0Y6_9ACTN|nr:alkane 1-monooxygenase [Planosporangium mesophilum]NJC82734.1 alkane 1-monooxygenase [Planosporangium mesophilum]GII23797.1 alkane 1-monooxygenase [Planosporangium mesophilum]